MKRNSLIVALIVIPITVLIAQIPTDGLVAYYPFNGNAIDESGNGNDGTIFQAVLAEDRFGNANSAYSYDGVDDYIEVQPSATINTANMNTISISAWVSTNDYNPFNQIITISNITDNTNLFMAIGTTVSPNPQLEDYNQFVFANYCGTPEHVWIWCNDHVTLNTWYHIVGIMDFTNKTGYLYVNGILVNTITGTVAIRPDNPKIKIGRPVLWEEWLSFNGKIDDIRIYNRPLSESEIGKLFNEDICYVTVYDTITTEVFDTTYVTVYDTIPVFDSIAVTDTLIIDAVLTGINPPDNINTLKIYPNPAKDLIFINTGDYTKMDGYQLKIINQTGAVVFETNVEEPLYEVNLSTWSGMGLYFIQVIDSWGNIVDIKKIVLQ